MYYLYCKGKNYSWKCYQRRHRCWSWSIWAVLVIKHESAIKEAESDALKRALKSFGDQFGLSLYDKDKAWLKPDDSKPTVSSNKPIDRSESDKFIKECEAFINKPANKDKLGLLKKNISKRYETNAISEDQRDGLLTLILEKEDS